MIAPTDNMYAVLFVISYLLSSLVSSAFDLLELVI